MENAFIEFANIYGFAILVFVIGEMERKMTEKNID